VDELALHVLDLVENARAAGASRVVVTVHEDLSTGWVELVVEDDGSGLADDERRQALDAFFTTRSSRRVGLGLALLSHNATQCGGGVELRPRAGGGTVVTARFQWAHPDRPPLGDMSGTLAVVVAANPELGLVYRHRRGERVFVLDTAEIRSRLGEVPINHLYVIDWIRSSCAESLRDLRGGVES
jgi:hypothetical protein